MKICQEIFESGNWRTLKASPDIKPTLILCFGEKKLLSNREWITQFSARYPHAMIISSSTSGEISNEFFTENSIVATAIEFEHTKTAYACVNIKTYSDTFAAGTALAARLPQDDLRFVMVYSDGMLVNGGDLVVAMNEVFESKIPMAGGLAGDGAKFSETVVGLNRDIAPGNIVAIGFYGSNIQLGFGSKGGWSHFGPTRTITRSDKNVLYELDGESALDLYKKYLGDLADKLPGSALHFPLSMESSDQEEVVRTILNIDEENKTMTFAGNVPTGAKVRFMKTTQHNLVEAASFAASTSMNPLQQKGDKLSILISCVGRKIILGSRIDEEIEAVRETLGNDVTIAGYYSHGEISPYSAFMKCNLHNQTMTITTISEQH